MNILVLTKLKKEFFKKELMSVEEYIKNDHFFDGFYEGFKKLGHTTYLNWEESFFIPQTLNIKSSHFSKFLRSVMKKRSLKVLDRYLFSKKIATFCEKNKIDMIFTEINSFISPQTIKKYYPKVTVTQWFGVFPEMVNKDTLKILSEYDYIWAPCEFDRKKITQSYIDKFRYIGCAVNDRKFYYDFDERYNYDVVFVGGVGKGHSNRIEFLEAIAQNYENFAFFGYGIENVPKHYKLIKKYKGWISHDEMRKLFSSSKIALNLTLDGYDRVKRGFNARLFEIAACGGAMQLCVYDEKINEFFTIGEDLDVFINPKECIEKIGIYLKDDTKRQLLSKNSLAKSKNFTYDVKAQKIIEQVSVSR